MRRLAYVLACIVVELGAIMPRRALRWAFRNKDVGLWIVQDFGDIVRDAVKQNKGER